jgi:uncharacterized membrane protein YfhO
VLATIGSYLLRLSGLVVVAGERGRLAFIRRAALALSSQFAPPSLGILIPLFFLFAVVLSVWVFSHRRLTSVSFLVLLVSLLMVDLVWNSMEFDHSFDRSRVFPRTEVTDLLHSLPPGRVLVVPSDLNSNRRVTNEAGTEKIIAPPNTLLPYQIATVTGKNQQFPKWYREFASLIEPQQNLSHVVFDEHRSPLFDLLNVRYVLTHESTPLDGYELLTKTDGVSLYENKNAMPRAFFAQSVAAVRTPAESLTRMRAPDFDPKAQTVVEVEQGSSLFPVEGLMPDHNPQPPGAASIVADVRNGVLIVTDNVTDGLLVLSDNYYPGWSAAVDGVPTHIFRANHTMRAVNLPAGHHVVSFLFMPAAFFGSMYVSLAGAALTLVALTLGAVKRRRE